MQSYLTPKAPMIRFTGHTETTIAHRLAQTGSRP
jgi:hypothetical protein